MSNGYESILDQVKAWERYFLKVYKRKPRMIEREQYMLGRLDGLRSLRAVQKVCSKAAGSRQVRV